MTVKHPTKKQQKLLDFVQEFSDSNNYSPSYREIMRAMNLKSVSAVAEHIENCVAAGFLRKTPNSPRSLEVIPQSNYAEAQRLFRQKISELHSKNPQHPDIQILQSAARILDLPL